MSDIATTTNITTTESEPKGWRAVLPVHPAADLFPLMSEAELRELADDIKKHGLTEQVTLFDDPELGLCLLDGRNRLDALELLDWEAGDLAYEPPSEQEPVPSGLYQQVGAEREFDPFAYVISKNIKRRHLTADQRRELIRQGSEGKAGAIEPTNRK